MNHDGMICTEIELQEMLLFYYYLTMLYMTTLCYIIWNIICFIDPPETVIVFIPKSLYMYCVPLYLYIMTYYNIIGMKYILLFGPKIVQLEHNEFFFFLKQLPIGKYNIINYFYLSPIIQFHLLWIMINTLWYNKVRPRFVMCLDKLEPVWSKNI